MNKQNCIGKLKTAHDSLEEVITSVSLEVESQLNTTAASQTKLTEADKMLQKLQKELQHATETLMAVIGSVCADEKVYLASSTEKLVTEVVARATGKTRVVNAVEVKAKTIPVIANTTPAATPVAKVVFTLDELSEMGTDLLCTKPMAITLPQGKRIEVKNWTDVATMVITWLGKKSKLPALPFKGTTNPAFRWFMNKNNTHSNGQPMVQCRKITVKGKDVYVDYKLSSATMVDRLKNLCSAVKVSAAGIKIELAPTVVKI